MLWQEKPSEYKINTMYILVGHNCWLIYAEYFLEMKATIKIFKLS